MLSLQLGQPFEEISLLLDEEIKARKVTKYKIELHNSRDMTFFYTKQIEDVDHNGTREEYNHGSAFHNSI